MKKQPKNIGKGEEYKPDGGIFAIGMTKKEIKVLVFWASVGISKSKSGSHANIAPKMIKYFAKELKIQLPVQPKFKI